MEKLIKKHADKIRFAIVGGTNTAIDMAILFILVNFFSVPIYYGNILSTSAALTFSFFANKKFTFQDGNKKTKSQVVSFFAITLFGLWIIQPIIMGTIKAVFGQIVGNDNITLLIGKVLATCVTLVWNYMLYRKFVFKKD